MTTSAGPAARRGTRSSRLGRDAVKRRPLPWVWRIASRATMRSSQGRSRVESRTSPRLRQARSRAAGPIRPDRRLELSARPADETRIVSAHKGVQRRKLGEDSLRAELVGCGQGLRFSHRWPCSALRPWTRREGKRTSRVRIAVPRFAAGGVRWHTARGERRNRTGLEAPSRGSWTSCLPRCPEVPSSGDQRASPLACGVRSVGVVWVRSARGPVLYLRYHHAAAGGLIGCEGSKSGDVSASDRRGMRRA